MNVKKTVTAGAVATVLGMSMLTAVAGPASATGDCAIGAACLYFNSGLAGASYEQSGNISDYLHYYFSANSGGSTGAGYSVKNNTASVDNWNPFQGIRLFVNHGYGGASQTIVAYGSGNLNGTLKNNNASGEFV